MVELDLAILDKVITDTIKHLEEGKEQISDIAETPGKTGMSSKRI